MFSLDSDIGFVSSADGIDIAFVHEVEAMAVERGSFGVVEDSLIREIEAKDRFKDISGFSGADSKRDMEG